MSISGPLARELEELAQDLDMVVFRLERDHDDSDKHARERSRLRRDLERLRDRLRDLSLGS